MSLRSESRRLRRVFGALVLTLAPAGAAESCSDPSADLDGRSDAGDAPGDDRADDGVARDASADVARGDDVTDAPPLGIDATCSVITEQLEAGPDATAAPDADFGCRYTLPCGLSEGAGFEIVGCAFYLAGDSAVDASLGCWIPESDGCMADVYVPSPNGSVSFQCSDCFGGGRRPPRLRRPSAGRSRSALGAYFAQMAHDEAASVFAFRGMGEDLARFGAPAELLAAASRSARDEERHARLVAVHARAAGGELTAPRLRAGRAGRESGGQRSLEAIACENAVEGCVRETFGALQLCWQASHASDLALRRLFARLAADETRHAALSQRVSQWVEPRLGAAARARVGAARTRAARALRATLSAPSMTSFDGLIGRPSCASAVALFDGMLARVPMG